MELNERGCGPSPPLLELLAELEQAVGRPVPVRDITRHPIEAVRGTVGATDSSGIWVALSLPQDEAEAVVAHEAMHLFQYARGWKIGATRIPPSGIGAILHELGSVLTTAVLDPQADSWAMDRGFQISEALQRQWGRTKENVIEKANLNMDLDPTSLRPIWDRLATSPSKSIRNRLSDDAIDEPMIKCLVEASDYFNMTLRAANLDMEFSHDELFERYLPQCREFGLRLVETVQPFDLKSRSGAEQALRQVFKFIRMNPRVMTMISPERLAR